MSFKDMRFVVSQKYELLTEIIIVEWSDGYIQLFSAEELGCEWFKMSNDDFFEKYGFNFNPHSIPGLYERCRKAVYQNG